MKNARLSGVNGETGGEFASEGELFPNFVSTPCPVNRFPIAPALRVLAESEKLESLCEFLTRSIVPTQQEKVLSFFIELRAGNWKKLRIARKEARRLKRAGKKIGGDTLPALLVPHGYARSNNVTRSLLVAALACGWPDEFSVCVTIHDKSARRLVQSGWRPFNPEETE